MCSLLGDDIPILAAGGIVDARGALAALSLGAEGIVMGSRFSVSNESAMAQKAKELIIQTKDGGRSTMRSVFPFSLLSWFYLSSPYSSIFSVPIP